LVGLILAGGGELLIDTRLSDLIRDQAAGRAPDLATIRSLLYLVWACQAGVFAVLLGAARALRRGQNAEQERALKRVTPALAPATVRSRGAEQSLTPRELEVLRLMATSCSYHDIAVQLVISEETVRTHTKNILRKLSQPDRARAVIAAVRAGILQLP
jgi:DNA-binding NarL/FixJ family response regulator